MEDLEWFADWRVWILVAVFGVILCPILFRQMVNDLAMPAWKAVILLTLATGISYIPGKLIIDRG